MWILTRYGSLMNEMCTTAGYSRYFFATCCILWLFVISHKLRIGLLAINHNNEPRYLFVSYSAFVCGLAGFATAVIFLIDRNWLGDLTTSQWTPSIGFFQCWFNPNAWSILIYFIGPILVLTIANWIMFALTAIQLIKVQRNVAQFILSSHNSNRNSYLRLVRICVMMGTSWVLDLIPYFYRGNVFWQWFFWLAYYYHLALGVVIFVLFVLKRSTIKLITER
ncbi:probable G-protein coupled receptor Mth-like 6 [Drosophila takahashii]|uniref:probable G-protein coupled receptor Mth-like 6 n=1 Tax=Drosophila takahashii TaxID=29030 RepID=UPI0038992BE6